MNKIGVIRFVQVFFVHRTQFDVEPKSTSNLCREKQANERSFEAEKKTQFLNGNKWFIVLLICCVINFFII